MEKLDIPRDWVRVEESRDDKGGLIYHYADGTQIRVTRAQLRAYLTETQE